jgi:general secretion pathway protein K
MRQTSARFRSTGLRQGGAALLAAMLTVTLVATFAAAALWQQWRSIEVEAAERARVQSEWVLTGALDWARLVLREDVRPSGQQQIDHLGEPWAVPLEEARLSSFLAADKSNTADTGPDVLDAFLSGQIVDLQSRLNVTNLLEGGVAASKISDPDLANFARLFELLGLPPAELERLAENLRFSADTSASAAAGSLAPLRPQRVEQLVWLGLSANSVNVLQPYVTILPSRTFINLNTASAEVIHAGIAGLSMADAQRLVTARERSPFRSVEEARVAVGATQETFAAGQVQAAVASNFFEVRSRLRLEQHVVEERAVVQRDGFTVKVLQRMRGAAEPPAAETGKR